MTRLPAVALALLLGTVPAGAADPDFDTIARQTGASVHASTAPDGLKAREMNIGGVVIREERRGSSMTLDVMDMSGRGAVICAWERYAAIAGILEVCAGSADQELWADLAEGLDAIGAFILANSLVPVTREQIEAKRQAHVDYARRNAEGLPADELDRICRSGGGARLLQGLRAMPRERFRASIEYLLAVKRPAVMSPC